MKGVREHLVLVMFNLCIFWVIPLELVSKVWGTEERTELK